MGGPLPPNGGINRSVAPGSELRSFINFRKPVAAVKV